MTTLPVLSDPERHALRRLRDQPRGGALRANTALALALEAKKCVTWNARGGDWVITITGRCALAQASQTGRGGRP